MGPTPPDKKLPPGALGRPDPPLRAKYPHSVGYVRHPGLRRGLPGLYRSLATGHGTATDELDTGFLLRDGQYPAPDGRVRTPSSHPPLASCSAFISKAPTPWGENWLPTGSLVGRHGTEGPWAPGCSSGPGPAAARGGVRDPNLMPRRPGWRRSTPAASGGRARWGGAGGSCPARVRNRAGAQLRGARRTPCRQLAAGAGRPAAATSSHGRRRNRDLRPARRCGWRPGRKGTRHGGSASRRTDPRPGPKSGPQHLSTFPGRQGDGDD